MLRRAEFVPKNISPLETMKNSPPPEALSAGYHPTAIDLESAIEEFLFLEQCLDRLGAQDSRGPCEKSETKPAD